MAGASRIPEIETWDRAAISIQHVVGFSNADCIGALVEHLVGQGARCIAFIGG